MNWYKQSQTQNVSSVIQSYIDFLNAYTDHVEPEGGEELFGPRDEFAYKRNFTMSFFRDLKKYYDAEIELKHEMPKEYEQHIAEKLNIVDYVNRDMIPLPEDDEEKKKIIREVYNNLNSPKHPVRNRMIIVGNSIGDWGKLFKQLAWG